ncbi:hypothetical protein AVEN_57739-1 [Araneus ventricosus]|uniref:Uncharacterized protein n=1 Tax=Araneus ventricosus TaxID=182803 RepID=A0A4Y2J3I5_ARAVE|nr:hypothetical protein AVEN_57739-1 [Araneus ventricosus]
MCLQWLNQRLKLISIRDSVSRGTCFQADHELQHCRRPFSSSFGRRRRSTTVRSSFCSIRGGRIPLLRERLHNAGLCFRATSCGQCPLNGRQRRAHAYVAENTFPGPVANGLLYSGRVRFTLESDSGRHADLEEEQRTRYHQSALLKNHSYRVVGSWFGRISTRWSHLWRRNIRCEISDGHMSPAGAIK